MRYRRKPVIYLIYQTAATKEAEAVQWTGENLEEIEEFAKGALVRRGPVNIAISTLEGLMRASKGDYIIKGMTGEFYPCKPDIFKATYEEVEE